MKKFLFVFLISCFSLTIISCSDEKEESTETATTTTTTTTQPWRTIQSGNSRTDVGCGISVNSSNIVVIGRYNDGNCYGAAMKEMA